jgi:predicted nucleotidyltransferase
MDRPTEVAREVGIRLAAVDGVAAVVLGGSRARGQADPHSDVDLGLYYDPGRPLAIAELRALAAEVDDRHLDDAVTEIGGWGSWINGGGWLEVGGVRVDWLYRDMSIVSAIIADCTIGRFSSHYQPGHPHAFHTHMYMAEVHHARALFDRDGSFAALQARTAPYPRALQDAILRSGWEADFALATAAKSVRRGDTFHVAGSLFRCAAVLVQMLFAANERYFLNEKRAVETAGAFPRCPPGFAATVTEVLAAPGQAPEALAANLARMEALVQAVRELCAAP